MKQKSIITQKKFYKHYEGEAKLICWSTGPTDPILSKNKKIILQNSGQLAFVKSIFCFLKNEKQKEIKHDKLPEMTKTKKHLSLIWYIINCEIFFCICYAKYCFLKNTDPKNQIILFSFCRPTDLLYIAVLPVDQNTNLVSPKEIHYKD